MTAILHSLLTLCFALVLVYSNSLGSLVDVTQSGESVYNADQRIPLDVASDLVKEVSLYALVELQKLSESRIYNTLSIDKIIKADQQDGIYHTNYILTIDLKSEHFDSDLETERYEFIVMKHLEDNVTSFAVNEFPKMKENKIEEFYIEKVKEKIIEKENTIIRLRIENVFFDRNLPEDITDVYDYDKNSKIKEELDKKSVPQLLAEIDTPQLQSSRTANSNRFIRRLVGDLAARERIIGSKSLADLYAIVVGGGAVDDFERYRAQRLMDISLELLSQMNQ